jgi:biopolymer transport protein ExbD
MKSLSITKKSFVPSDALEAEIDIDVKPMMNVLLILIPFLVSVSVYTRLSIVEMSLPPNVTGASSTQSGKPKLKLTVVVATQFVSITYGEKMLDSLALTNDKALIGPHGISAWSKPDYAYERLLALLKDRRGAVDEKGEVIVASRDGISFKYVVRIMDACKKAGFEKVSLASATESPN